MSAINRLYKKDNKTIQKCIALDNELYEKLKEITENDYDATISDLINVCVEDYINQNSPSYYAKPFGELSISRSIMLRKENIKGLQKFHRETGISVTRLLNASIKIFIDNYNKSKK